MINCTHELKHLIFDLSQLKHVINLTVDFTNNDVDHVSFTLRGDKGYKRFHISNNHSDAISKAIKNIKEETPSRSLL